MRTFVIAAVVILAAVLLGWLSFTADSDGASARLNTDEVSRDVEETAETTSKAVNAAAESVEKSTND